MPSTPSIMGNVAIIPARGGSKRIPRKNIKLFKGKPIIVYSIQTALRSELFDLVMVSTDDEEIAKVASKNGAEVPFLRSKDTSDDHSQTAEVLLEVIQQLENNHKRFDFACCLYPTAPLTMVENIVEGYRILREKKYTSVFPVCPFNYPIMRALRFNHSGNIEMIWPENMSKRSQDLPSTYHDAGQFYWLDVPSFLREKRLFSSNSGSLVLNELQAQDIDNESDWKIAEMKHSLLFVGE